MVNIYTFCAATKKCSCTFVSLVNQTPPIPGYIMHCTRSGQDGVWHIMYARTLAPTGVMTAIQGQPLATKFYE